MLVLIGVYWVFQINPTVSTLYLCLSTSLVLWIVICENIVSIDNLLGSHVTRELRLGMQLQAYAQTYLKQQDQILQTCCGDPLSFHYRPGTLYQRTYDCGQFTGQYKVVVDPTGYLNRRPDLIADGKQVDVFVAGDSVLQGFGVPGVVEFLNESLPIKMWNLSVSNSGPMQKVNALISYALPQRPKWILIDFLAANDIYEAIIHEACGSTDFRCLFAETERRRRVAGHPMFSAMVDESKDRDIFADYAENNFTLAVTRYLMGKVKGKVKAAMNGSVDGNPCNNNRPEATERDGSQAKRLSVSEHPITAPGYSYGEVHLKQGKEFEWQEAGLRLTYKAYDHLAAEMVKTPQSPAVILLYNPSAYEIYRDVLFDRDREADRVSESQRQALSDYAGEQGWKFLDLTATLHDEVARSGFWLYGANDWVHWSPQGTLVVASVLARELVNVFGKEIETLAIASQPVVQESAGRIGGTD
jgi:hypothetical protein